MSGGFCLVGNLNSVLLLEELMESNLHQVIHLDISKAADLLRPRYYIFQLDNLSKTLCPDVSLVYQ